MVMVCPVPSIVKLPDEVFATAGRVLPSVIVPLTLKLMVSVPVPTMQSPPVVSVPGLLALLIASRRVQNPLPEVLAGSVVLLTSIILTPACSSDRTRTTQTGAITISRAISNPGRAMALEALALQAIAKQRPRSKRAAAAFHHLSTPAFA
jgi:hypothetical protein